MLTFADKGRTIGKIIGGEYNGEIISLDYPNNKNLIDIDGNYIEESDSDSDYENDDNSDDDSDEIYMGKGVILPVPSDKSRDITYVAAPSGAGKTTYAAQLANNFKLMYPNLEIFVFSRKDVDKAFEKLNPTYIPINDDMVKNPIDLTKELKEGALVIFDDIATIPNKKQKDAVDKLISDIIEVGRSYNVHIIVTSHLVIPNEKNLARIIMNELTSITFFPRAGSSQQIKYALTKYFELTKEQINEVLDIDSRWITIFKHHPKAVMYEKGAFILK